MILGLGEGLLFLSQNVRTGKALNISAGIILIESLIAIGLEYHFQHKGKSPEDRPAPEAWTRCSRRRRILFRFVAWCALKGFLDSRAGKKHGEAYALIYEMHLWGQFLSDRYLFPPTRKTHGRISSPILQNADLTYISYRFLYISSNLYKLNNVLYL